jgi:hypothetical protein
MHHAAQPAPHDNITPGDDFGAWVDVSNDYNMPRGLQAEA